MYRPHAATFALAIFAGFIPSRAWAQVDCAGNTPYTQRQLLVQGRYVDYYASHDLGVYNPDVKRAVFMVHGQSGLARDYYDALDGSKCVAELLGWAPNATRENILIAPHFLGDDQKNVVLPSDHHYWKGNSWAAGYHSEVSPTVSSFSVMDAFISQLTAARSAHSLARRFPNLRMIVVAGLSAGGQLAQRYAATNSRDGNLSGIQMRYVVASPSSYLYLDNRRPYYDDSEGVGVPWVRAGYPPDWYPGPGFYTAPFCPLTYNAWKYGLDTLNTYAGAVGVAAIRERLLSRNVIVLVGTEDNDPHDDTIDIDCPALLQGPGRFDRGHKFVDYLDERFPTHHHWLIEVPGAHHDVREFFGPRGGLAETGSLVLFADF